VHGERCTRTAPLALAIVVVLTAACYEEQPETPLEPEPATQSTSIDLPSLSDQELGEHPDLLAVARDVPSFAGFYFDDEGLGIVRLTEATGLEAAVQRIRPLLPSSENDVAFAARPATHSFLALATYRALLRDRVFSVEGVVSLGVDELLNRVHVGVEDTRMAPEIAALLLALGIPEDAVVIERRTRGTPLVPSVGLSTSPVRARVSHDLDSEEPNGHLYGGYRFGIGCTIGFAALRRATGDSVFVSNSHCTTVDHEFDGIVVGQPAMTPSKGAEILDPDGFNCIFWICRHSDTAMFETYVPIQLGKIARTTSSSNCESCVEDLTIDHTNPTLSITARNGFIVLGQVLQKIGNTTGWTYGSVVDTCSDVVLTDGWKRLCADQFDASVDPGDSGSPVFSVNFGNVTLRGIVFGKAGGDDDVIMSSLTQVEKDMGGLVYYDLGPPSVSIEGSLHVRTGLLCDWSALVGGGIDPFDVVWSGVFSGTGSTISRVATTTGWLEVDITDWSGRTASSMEYITVSPTGPTPPGCTE
jgi:hypothetical protein